MRKIGLNKRNDMNSLNRDWNPPLENAAKIPRATATAMAIPTSTPILTLMLSQLVRDNNISDL